MNPYVILASQVGTPEAASLCTRVTAWHDAMVSHERRRRRMPKHEVCDDDCPPAEARALWTEAVAIFGVSAAILSFLRSRGLSRPPFDIPADSSNDTALEF